MKIQPTLRPRAADRRRNAPKTQSLPLRAAGEMPAAERRCGDRRRLGFISQMDLFQGVPYSAVEDILDECPVRSFSESEVLLEPGQTNASMFLVLEGRLQVHLDAADSGNAIFIESGGCIGEMSIIDGKPVSAFVLAEGGSRIAVIGHEQFWSMVLDHPQSVRNILAMLTERMRRNNEAVLKGLRERLILEHMQKEMRLAQEIQIGMLPATFRLPGLNHRIDLHACMQPAREVGGDLYDFFIVPPAHVCLLVGDVSDKGIPAALFMARTIEIVRRVARLPVSGREQPDPASILAETNSSLCENNPSRMFVTMFLAILDPRTGQLSYCNAGHNAAYIRSRGHALCMLDAKPSAPLGVKPLTEYRRAEVHLRDGDMLFAYTDGVTEAADPGGALFGEDRLERELREILDHRAAAVTESILGSVRRFAGDAVQSDDITMLAVRLLPNA